MGDPTALPAFLFVRPNGAKFDSPGQGPGKWVQKSPEPWMGDPTALPAFVFVRPNGAKCDSPGQGPGT